MNLQKHFDDYIKHGIEIVPALRALNRNPSVLKVVRSDLFIVLADYQARIEFGCYVFSCGHGRRF